MVDHFLWCTVERGDRVDRTELAIQKIMRMWESGAGRPFPYDDVRRLTRDAAHDFGKYAPDDVVSADLNEYFTFVAGLASGGIRRYLGDQSQVQRIRGLLQLGFFERYPQYGFLTQRDLSAYPNLCAELEFTDKLRLMLLELLDIESEHLT